MRISGKYLSRAACLAALFAAAGAPTHAADDYPAQQITAQQRCPVCGMYPARYAAWATQVVFKDSSMTALESPAELFRFLRNIKKYDAQHTASDIAGIYVTDYSQRALIDAKQASYVQGSKAKGPMGADLPAFASRPAAETFAKESGGSVMTFDALVSVQADHAAHEHGHY